MQQHEDIGRRERKRQETQLRIEDEATRLFLERSFEEVTLEDICAAAEISRRTFFNYFETKDHVAVGPTPPPLDNIELDAITAHDAHATGVTLPAFLLNHVGVHRIRAIEEANNTSINPELAREISQRRRRIQHTHPHLAMTRLTHFHQLRNSLLEVVEENLRAFPGNRTLPELPESEEAVLTVTALVTSMWSTAMMSARLGPSTLTAEALYNNALGLGRLLTATADTPGSTEAEAER